MAVYLHHVSEYDNVRHSMWNERDRNVPSMNAQVVYLNVYVLFSTVAQLFEC